jgi:hypothetical protein
VTKFIVHCDSEKSGCPLKSSPRSCKVISSYLNPGTFAEYTGHLIQLPVGYHGEVIGVENIIPCMAENLNLCSNLI